MISVDFSIHFRFVTPWSGCKGKNIFSTRKYFFVFFWIFQHLVGKEGEAFHNASKFSIRSKFSNQKSQFAETNFLFPNFNFQNSKFKIQNSQLARRFQFRIFRFAENLRFRSHHSIFWFSIEAGALFKFDQNIPEWTAIIKLFFSNPKF